MLAVTAGGDHSLAVVEHNHKRGGGTAGQTHHSHVLQASHPSRSLSSGLPSPQTTRGSSSMGFSAITAVPARLGSITQQVSVATKAC